MTYLRHTYAQTSLDHLPCIYKPIKSKT